MTEIQIEKRVPPTPKTGIPGQVANFVDALKRDPGVFMVYCTNSNYRTAYSKAQQYKKRYPGSEWIVRSEDAGYTVFGRWLSAN